MKLSLNLLILFTFAFFATIEGSKAHKKCIVKPKVASVAETTILTTTTTIAKPIQTSVPVHAPVNNVISPVKNETLENDDENSSEEETEKKESQSSAGTVTFVGLALIAVAAGGMSYRSKAKKHLDSPELFKYKLGDNEIYDNTPKNSSLSYSFDSTQFHEEQARINFYEDASKKTSEPEYAKRLNIILPTNRAYKAVLPWEARCVDEIQLNCGDLVCIKESYPDGYSLGRNLTTRFDGIFPTCCLNNIGTCINQQEVRKWQSVGMYTLPKRAVAPTKKAKRASRGISLLTVPDWTKKLENLKLDSPISEIL